MIRVLKGIGASSDGLQLLQDNFISKAEEASIMQNQILVRLEALPKTPVESLLVRLDLRELTNMCAFVHLVSSQTYS